MTITISIRAIGTTRHPGDTIWITAVMTDEDNESLTPDTQTITLRDPNGTIQVTDNAPTLLGDGNYESKMTIPASGIRGVWTVRWVVVKNSDQETEVTRFVVHAFI